MTTVPPSDSPGATNQNELQANPRDNGELATAQREHQTSADSEASTGASEESISAAGRTANTANEASVGHDAFECNICFETAKDAIVTLCGHLFCWPCLHAWLEQKPPGIQTCPVCKSVVDRNRVVPLYGRGNQRSSTPSGSQPSPVDPRAKTDDTSSTVPDRPRGQWQQAPANQDDYYMPFFGTRPGGVHVSFGIGSFPFGFFNATIGGNVAVDQQVDPSLMSTLFLLLGMLLVAWVIFA